MLGTSSQIPLIFRGVLACSDLICPGRSGRFVCSSLILGATLSTDVLRRAGRLCYLL